MISKIKNTWILWTAFAFLLLPGIRTISHSDFWQHLSIGRWIASNGIPRTDPLMVVSEGARWVNVHWLYDWVLYGLYSMGGAVLTTFTHVFLIGLAFFLLIRTSSRWAGPIPIALSLILSAWILAFRFEVQPVIPALFFAALLLHMLSKSAKTVTLFAVLLPLQWAWANTHPSFFLAPLITLFYLAQTHLQSPSENPAQQNPSPKRVLSILALSLLVVPMLNPYGYALYGAVFQSIFQPVPREWISPYAGLFLFAMPRHLVTIILIVGAIGLLTQKRSLPIALTATAMCSAFLTVQSINLYIEFLAVLAFPFFCMGFSSGGQYVQDMISPHQTRIKWWSNQLVLGGTLGLLILSTISILTNGYYVRSGSLSSFGLGLARSTYPSGVRHVLEHPDFPTRFVNMPMDGGYLAWHYPDRMPFIDLRTNVYDPESFSLLAHGLLGRQEAWRELNERWAPEAVILNNAWAQASDVVQRLQNDGLWETVYFDGVTTVLIRATADRRDLLRKRDTWLKEGLSQIDQERHSYRDKLGSFRKRALPTRIMGAAPILHSRGYIRETASFYDLLSRYAPNMVSAHAQLGICMIQLGEHEQGVGQLRKVTHRLPKNSNLLALVELYIGIGLTQHGAYFEAVRQLTTVTEQTPQNPMAWLWLYRASLGADRGLEAQRALEEARKLNADIADEFIRLMR